MAQCTDCKKNGKPENWRIFCEGCQWNKEEIFSSRILEVLEKQQFNDFYNGKFETYLQESGKVVTQAEILKEIQRLFCGKS